MIDGNRGPRGYTAGGIALALIGTIVLCAGVPRAAFLPTGEIATSAGEQQAYDAARARLAGMLAKVQQADGLVPQESIAPVVAGLNQALDKLELARVALASGASSQALANITAANSIMDGLEAPIANLVARADSAKRTNLLLAAAGVGLACAAVVLLLLLKRRRDKERLRSFLAAEIDYSKDAEDAKGSTEQ